MSYMGTKGIIGHLRTVKSWFPITKKEKMVPLFFQLVVTIVFLLVPLEDSMFL